MDYESRLSKVEAQLEMNRIEIDRLYRAIDELRRLMLERFDRTDLSISELRQHTDQQLAAGLTEVRREANVNMRWMMGMWLTTIGFIAGLGGRVLGMY